MGVIKGTKSIIDTTRQDVTTTRDGDNVGLDVSIIGGSTSAGTGTGTELEGANALASGSILYGLEYRRIIKQASPDTITDIFNVYSDSAGTNLISILTIIFETSDKNIVMDAQRDDQ